MVVTFQPDGEATLNSLGVYRPKLDRNRKLSSLTFCARLKLFYLHGRDTYFQLRDDYANLPYMIKGGDYNYL